MLRDIKAAAIHGESETISEKLAYRKFIKDSEFETREVFEPENIEERKSIKNIETRLRMTRLDNKQMENIEECENIKNIETQLRMTWLHDQRMENIEECENINNIETRLSMTRSENSSTENSSKRSKKQEPKVNLDPDPSSSD